MPAESLARGAAHLLDAALRVIGRAGLDGLTHRAVAAEAGMSLGAVTHRFGKREALVDAALAHAVAQEAARVARFEAALGDAPLDLPRWTAAVAAHYARELAGDPDLHLACYEALLAAARDPARRPLAETWLEAWRAGPRLALAAAGSPDPDRHAALIRDALIGMILRALARGEGGPDFETAMREDLLSLARALCARP